MVGVIGGAYLVCRARDRRHRGLIYSDPFGLRITGASDNCFV